MMRRRYNGFLLSVISVISVVISLLPLTTSAALSVTATFNQSGISGAIRFTQESPGGNTTIDVNLIGKEREGERENETNCSIEFEMGKLLTYFPGHRVLSRLLGCHSFSH
jgi:hypothetical protein